MNSFRRPVFYAPDLDTPVNTPESMLVNFQEESLRIFLIDETTFCSHCRDRDHQTLKCKTKQVSDQPAAPTQKFVNSHTSKGSKNKNVRIHNNPR